MEKLILIQLVVTLFSMSALSQQKAIEDCKGPVQYENKNQVDPKPLSLTVISGKVIVERDELPVSATEYSPVAGACLGLFGEKELKLITSSVADNAGRFDLGKVPPGNYRLIVRAGSLCVANVPLRVIRDKGRSKNKQPEIIIHMRAEGIDTCSYGDYISDK